MANMGNKNDVGGIEHEVIIMNMELDNAFKHVIQRISDMEQYKKSGSVEFGDIEKLNVFAENTRKCQEDASKKFSLLMKQYFDPRKDPKIRKHLRRDTIQVMKSVKENIEKIYRGLQNVHKILDELEEKFRKYNVPKRDVHRSSPESFDCYLERLREFVQVTWKEVAKKCRQKGHRSFIEWMVKLGESEDDEKRTTFKVLRGVLIEIGNQISWLLIEYFLFMSVSAETEEMAVNLSEVESLIRCLSVVENSIVIDSFVSVVKLFDRTLRKAKPPKDKAAKVKRSKKIKNDDPLTEKENDVLSVFNSLSKGSPFSDQDTKEKCDDKIGVKKDDSPIDKENDVLSLLSNPVKDTTGKHENKIDKVNKDGSQIEKENDVLHLIIIEVLRLEVGFCYPDLPMMVSNEVYYAMGEHVMDNVFEDRLNFLSAKIDGLKLLESLPVGDNDSMRKSCEQLLDLRVKEIWNKLDLKPRS